MVQITFFKRETSESICGIQATGQTGYAEYGYDIVSAAISTLLITAANGLMMLAKYKKDEIDLLDTEDTLKFCIPSDSNRGRFRKATIILETTRIGLESIIEKYPDNLQAQTVLISKDNTRSWFSRLFSFKS